MPKGNNILLIQCLIISKSTMESLTHFQLEIYSIFKEYMVHEETTIHSGLCFDIHITHSSYLYS
jgi:hypothetical protein